MGSLNGTGGGLQIGSLTRTGGASFRALLTNLVIMRPAKISLLYNSVRLPLQMSRVPSSDDSDSKAPIVSKK